MSTAEEVKALADEQRKTWEEFKAIHKRLETEVKTLGEGRGETKAHLDKLNERLDELDKRIAATEAKANRPDFVRRDPSTPEPSEAKAAFFKWARTNMVTPEESKLLIRPGPGEYKALTVGDATQAGYLAPPEYVREIIKGIVEFSPVRSLARIRTTSQKSVQVPKRTGTFAAVWVAEVGTRAETTGLAYGLEEIPAHEAYGLVDVSFAMLEDSVFDLEAELREEFSEQFGVTEGTAFVSGTGVGQPEGVLTNAAISYSASGDANLITGDGLISLYFDVKDYYARRGTWLLKRSTLKAIRQLKESTTGNYLWQPGLAGSTPATILDRPYMEAVDMPAIAANAFPVVFGDWNRGYNIVDRIEINVVRDPYTQAGSGKVRFHARKRVGGQVVVAEALRKLKIATS